MFSSEDTFQLSSYHVSHQTLIIRRPWHYAPNIESNIDLVFYGVFYMEVVNYYEGLILERPTESEIKGGGLM